MPQCIIAKFGPLINRSRHLVFANNNLKVISFLISADSYGMRFGHRCSLDGTLNNISHLKYHSNHIKHTTRRLNYTCSEIIFESFVNCFLSAKCSQKISPLQSERIQRDKEVFISQKVRIPFNLNRTETSIYQHFDRKTELTKNSSDESLLDFHKASVLWEQ